MAETLGSLCDKLTIVKLKQWHTEEEVRLQSLQNQENQLITEINDFIALAVSGMVPTEKLAFAANKIFKAEGNTINEVQGSIGAVFAHLAKVNTDLWHEQEKVYEFEKVPALEKDKVVKQLALLNLERNSCIDKIDKQFQQLVVSISK